MKKIYLYVFTTVLIWSTLPATVKILLSDIPNLEALSISSYLGFLFLLVTNIKNKVIKNIKKYSIKDYYIMAGLGFVGVFTYSTLYYYGLSQLNSQEACILNYLWPMMLVLFSCIILKEKLTFIKILAMLCSFIGILILSSGGNNLENGSRVLGIVSCIVAAACYGLFSVLNKKTNYEQSFAMMMFWLVTAICSMALGMGVENWIPIKGVQWLGMIWLGVVINAIAYLLWALALSDSENTAIISNFAYLTPVLSLCVSAVILKEKIEAKAMIALIFIVGGILIQNVYYMKKDRNRKNV